MAISECPSFAFVRVEFDDRSGVPTRRVRRPVWSSGASGSTTGRAGTSTGRQLWASTFLEVRPPDV
jgi:hypothetical protein